MGKKKTTEMFKEEVFEAVENEYTVLGEYVKAKVKILMLHNFCKQTFEMTPDNFKSGQRCSHCFGNKKKTTEQFKEEVFNLVGDEYIVLGEYKTTHSKIKFLHSKCGKEFEMIAKSFVINERRCSHCREKQKDMGRRYAKTTNEFKDEVIDLTGSEYEVIGEYISTHKNIEMLHVECGHKYSVAPSNFLSGKRCPKCRLSKGEKEIQRWLCSNGFNYTHQYKFNDCRYKKPLSFDFAVFDNNNNLLSLLEFDGIQHFETIDGWGGNGKLEDTKKRDIIKNEYCKNNDINLIRIPYWNYDEINNILTQELL